MLDQEGIKKAFCAARKGDINNLRSLDLSGFSSPGLTDSAGASIIHHAARSGTPEALKLLIVDKGLSGSSRSYVGATPAHDAAATGCLSTLQWLLDHTDCTVSDTDQSGATVTHLAARYGHLMVLKWLVTQGSASLTLKTDSGALPIHFAAARGDLDTVKFLIEQKPRTINSQMSCGASACYLAAQEGHLEVLKYLVEEGGASLRILSYDGMSCLHAAAQTGKLDTVKWLMMEHKMSPNERDFDGATTVHFAAGRGHPVVLDWLLENGAKLMVDNLGGSPLHDAAEHGRLHLEALKSLLGSGKADQHSLGVVIYGSSAYHSILQCVRILLKYGCDPSIRDNNGLTAADLAENCWHRECAATLRRRLTKGVNGNFVPANRERLSVRDFFVNGVNGTTNLRDLPSDSEGSGSDYVDLDNGSISSSFYMVHSPLWRAPAGISARNFNSETGELTDNGSSPSSTYQRPGYMTIPPPPSSPPPPVPEKQPSPTKRNGRLFPGKKRMPDYENIDPNLQIPKSQVQGLLNRSKPVLSRYQPGASVHINDENGESYIRMGPGTETESGSSSDLHVIREESFTEPNTPDPDSKDAPPNVFDIPPAPPPPPIQNGGNKKVSSGVTPSPVPAPPPPPPPDSGHSSRTSSFSTSSMPRNINLEELKAKFSGLRPALRPASPGQQSPNMDLIAELKSNNWTASLKKTKKKRQGEENKENEDTGPTEPKNFWKDLQKKTMSPKKTSQKRDRSPSERLVGKYDPKNYINKVPSQDASGNELPQWKRLLIAKQFAEKSLVEDEEQARKEEEERRFKDMPGWKRAILEKKEAENRAKREREQDLAALEWAKRNPGKSSALNERNPSAPIALDEDGLPMTPWQAELRERRDSKSSNSDNSRGPSIQGQ